MKTYKLVLLSVFGFVFLFLLFMVVPIPHRQPLYVKLSKKIFFDYARDVKREYNLNLSKVGGAMMHDVKQVFAGFTGVRSVTHEEARRLYVEVLEGFLDRYNSSEEIRPYLHDYPFGVSNIELMLSFVDENRGRPEYGKMALVFVGKDQTIYYETYNHQNKDFETLFSEPYTEAREIVMGEKSFLPEAV